MPTSSVNIRPFEDADLETLHQIRELAFRPVFASFREIIGSPIADVAFLSAETEQEEHLSELCKPDTSDLVFVAEVDANIVGFVAVSLDQTQKVGEIGLNAVHPDFAGRGIGTEMYVFALQKMKAAGMLVATVGTGGDASHAPARRAYQKAGFGPSLPTQWMYRSL